MLQGEINRFPTVGCFRADVVVFLGFKKFAERLVDQRTVIGDQYRPSHGAFGEGEVTLALRSFIMNGSSRPYPERSNRDKGLSRGCKLPDHFFVFFRASSNFAAALIRAICTSSSAPPDAVSQTSCGLA